MHAYILAYREKFITASYTIKAKTKKKKSSGIGIVSVLADIQILVSGSDRK